MINKIKKPDNLWFKIKLEIKSILHTRTLSSEFIARSIFFGGFVALTPTFGIQMPIVVLLWTIFKFSRFRFNLAIGISITWITNYFTFIPYYFICYYTGIWLGDHIFIFKSPISYERFSVLWQSVLDADFLHTFAELAKLLLKIGKPLFLGSIPYAIIISIALYKITYIGVVRYRKSHPSLKRIKDRLHLRKK